MFKKFCYIFFGLFLFPKFAYSQNWQSLGAGTDQAITALYTDTTTNLMYVGGQFKYADTTHASGIVAWNGSQFDSLQNGVDKQISMYPGPVRTITKCNGKIYAGGDFSVAGDIYADYIASWDGTQWDSLPKSPDNVVLQLMEYGGELYACGAFTSIGGVTYNSIAKFDGTNWSIVGDNRVWNTGVVTCMCFYKGELYIGGGFYDTPSGIENIAKWNGSAWVAPGGIGIYGSVASVLSMKVYQNELYVGGLFKKSDGNVGTAIVKWDSLQWTDPGGGMTGVNPRVQWMEIHNNYLYACGIFNTAGGVPAMGLARWDGVDWCGYNTTFDNNVLSIAFLYDTMYVAGGFWTINGDSMSYISKYIGSGPDTCGHLNVGIEEYSNSDNLEIHPNPSEDVLNIKTAFVGKGSAEIMNTLGQVVIKENLSFSGNSIEFNIASLARGVYILSLDDGKERRIARFVKK
jgi:hypothetical protein